MVELRQDDLGSGLVPNRRHRRRTSLEHGLGVVRGEAEAQPGLARARREGIGRRFRSEDDKCSLPLRIRVRARVS